MDGAREVETDAGDGGATLESELGHSIKAVLGAFAASFAAANWQVVLASWGLAAAITLGLFLVVSCLRGGWSRVHKVQGSMLQVAHLPCGRRVR